MREILFRAKRLDNGEWIHGDLKHGGYYDRDDMYIGVTLGQTVITYPVIPETVGQYTGQTDKNGTKIFEGDIVKSTDRFDKSVVYFVEFKDGAFMLKQRGVNYHIYFNDLPEKYYCMEVIGNIHDNPELLEGEK